MGDVEEARTFRSAGPVDGAAGRYAKTGKRAQQRCLTPAVRTANPDDAASLHPETDGSKQHALPAPAFEFRKDRATPSSVSVVFINLFRSRTNPETPLTPHGPAAQADKALMRSVRWARAYLSAEGDSAIMA